MNLEKLRETYDLHDAILINFNYSLKKRTAICELEIDSADSKTECTIEFKDIGLFHIEANNTDFKDNELIDINVSSKDTEYFRAFFSEGFMKPGKLIEITCTNVEIIIVKPNI